MQVEVSPKLGKTLNLMLTESQEFRRKISKHGYPIKIDQVQEAMVLGGHYSRITITLSQTPRTKKSVQLN